MHAIFLVILLGLLLVDLSSLPHLHLICQFKGHWLVSLPCILFRVERLAMHWIEQLCIEFLLLFDQLLVEYCI